MDSRSVARISGRVLRLPILPTVPCSLAMSTIRPRCSSGAGTTCWRSAQPAPTTADHLPKVSWSVTRSAAHGITPVSACAGTLRQEGYAGAVTLLSADAAPPCDRPNLSKDYLAGTAEPDWIPLRQDDFYSQHNIDLRLGTRVSAIDPQAHALTLADGSSLRYGALLLATGAEPVRLNVPGASLPHVHELRTFADSNAIIARAGAARSCVVIGASFIGLE